MSLPARQQRALDGIAEGLRISEPRLTAMFATFTRLTLTEQRPHREQLADAGVLARIAARWRRLHSRRSAVGRRAWQRVLIIGQVAIAFVLLAVLVGVSAGTPGRCSSRSVHVVSVDAARSPACAAQAGPDGALPGK